MTDEDIGPLRTKQRDEHLIEVVGDKQLAIDARASQIIEELQQLDNITLEDIAQAEEKLELLTGEDNWTKNTIIKLKEGIKESEKGLAGIRQQHIAKQKKWAKRNQRRIQRSFRKYLVDLIACERLSGYEVSTNHLGVISKIIDCNGLQIDVDAKVQSVKDNLK